MPLMKIQKKGAFYLSSWKRVGLPFSYPYCKCL